MDEVIVEQTVNQVTVEPVVNTVSVATPGPQGPQGPAGVNGDPSSLTERIQGGYAVVNRYDVNNGIVNFTSGDLRASSFWAPETMTVSSIGISTAAASPQSGATDIRYCLYSVDPDTSMITLLAQTDNVNDALTVANTHYIRPLQTPVAVTKGLRYAVGVFTLGGTSLRLPASNLTGGSAGTGMNSIPPLPGLLVAGQSDPPASATAGATSFAIFAAIYSAIVTLDF